MLRYADTCARLKCVALNNDSGPSILRGLSNVRNMLKFHLTDAFALLVCLFMSPGPTNAQAPETRLVPVTVVTADGKPVTILDSQNVRVHDRGVQVKSFRLDESPRRIVLLLDTSVGMGINDRGKPSGEPRLAVASELMNLFLDSVPASDSLALYQFADSPREVVPFTHDAAAIRQAISTLTPDRERDIVGRSNIRDALSTILTNLQEPLAFGDSIVIFSDGDWNSERDKRPSLDSLASAIVQDGVRIFLVLAQEDSAVLNQLQTTSTGVTQVVPVPRNPPLQNPPIGLTPDYEKERIVDSESFVDAVGGATFAPAALSNVLPRNSVFLSNYPGQRMQSLSPADQSNILQSTIVFHSNDPGQRMKSLGAAVQSAYRLELQLSGPLRRKKRLHLNLVDGRGKSLHNVAVLSPELVYPDARTHP